MDNLFDEHVTVLNNKRGEIVAYRGSDIFQIRYMEGNKTRSVQFHIDKIDFNGQDVEYLKKAYR